MYVAAGRDHTPPLLSSRPQWKWQAAFPWPVILSGAKDLPRLASVRANREILRSAQDDNQGRGMSWWRGQWIVRVKRGEIGHPVYPVRQHLTADSRLRTARLGGESMVATLERPVSRRKMNLSVIDCDIHPNLKSPDALDPYLSERWRQHRRTIGRARRRRIRPHLGLRERGAPEREERRHRRQSVTMTNPSLHRNSPHLIV